MAKTRLETGLTVVVAAVGVVVLVVLGIYTYMVGTARPLHPVAQEAPSVAHADPPPQFAGAVERARQILRAALAEQNLPGLSAAVGAGGEVVWAEGFGWADLDTRVPVAPGTRFRIGTASTVFTSAAVGLLIESGRLRLDEEIQRYVPEYPEHPRPVTLRQLMGHTAGLRNDGGDEGPLLAAQCDRPIDALPAFAERPLLFDPGTEFRDSSYGWIVVSAAVEAAAGEPFLTFVHRQIVEPLGLAGTRADAAAGSIPDRAVSYFPRFAAEPRYGPHPMRPIDLSCYAGAGVFLSTPSDLVRFAMAIADGRLLKPATVRLLQEPQRLASGQETGYGLGWDLETAALGGRDTPSVGHDGEVLGGPVASLASFPEHGLAVAVASNISYAGTAELARRVAEAFTLDSRTAFR